MRTEFLPFTKPWITEDDISAVGDVLRSGWITNGPKNVEFEQNICAYTGNRFGVALASATGGMHLLMKALGLGAGDEVITPSLTWVSTVNMIVLAGATPVFAEIDRNTLMVTPESIAACITPRTRLIVPVHYAGSAVDLDGIYGVANKHGIPVVQDTAHALGTFYKGQHVAASGHAIYSFHAIKNVTTGEGGMFVTDDEDMAKKIRRWKFHGLGVDAFDRNNRGRAPQAEVVEPGFKYNITDICTVIGIRQLARIDEITSRRTALAMRYRELLAGIDEIIPLSDPSYDFKHSWHLFIVRVNSPKMSRIEFMEKLKLENIGSGLHFLAAHTQKYYREVMGFKRGMLPDTEWNSDRICSLPLFPEMKLEDVDDVVAAIKKVLANG